ncbi:MFS transporter [Savagea sp. SN6]|uniref:MFS transporter n=1 Tax=Savagea serpentis TaxID=2785297 RepID=A0A8J7G076_9BACL|nr:MFS transporter [Savagea serpentis]MBF4499780.1 MFS transporter [Savagea serpentis]
MPKRAWLLIFGMFINIVGASFLWPLNTIYMHEYLGKTLTVAGFVLMANAGAGVIGNLLGGMLFDKLGGYRTLMLGSVISILALIVLVFRHDFVPYVIFLTILGFSSGIVFPSLYAMIGAVWPEGGRKAFNAMYLANNIGVAIGPAVAGLVAARNIDAIFSANLAFYIGFLFLAFFGYRNLVADTGPATVLNQRKEIRQKAPFYALLIISLGYLVTWIIYSQWSTTISTHALSLGVTLTQYSLIWTVNGVVILLGQPIIAPIVKRFENQLKVQMLIGLTIFFGSFIFVSFAETFGQFLMAMVVLTFGEILLWPAIPTIANQLAPKGRNGFYQGIVNSAATIGKMIGPVAGGVFVDLYDMHTMILMLTSLLLITFITTVVYDRPLRKAEQLRQ